MDALAALVASLDHLGPEGEEAAFESIRALARTDPTAFLASLLALPDGSSRGEAIEALTLADTFDVAFEPIVDGLLAWSLDRIARHPGADSTEAEAEAMSFYPLGDLADGKLRPEFQDRVYDRVVAHLGHAHPSVRMTLVELVACWSRATRLGSRDPVIAILESDPDPLLREVAFRSLAEENALPTGAKRPWSPHTFRGLRRWFATR